MPMDMGRDRPKWQSVVLSTLHCGAGCTLADLIGESFLYFVPVAIGGSAVVGGWALDYALALCIGNRIVENVVDVLVYDADGHVRRFFGSSADERMADPQRR